MTLHYEIRVVAVFGCKPNQTKYVNMTYIWQWRQMCQYRLDSVNVSRADGFQQVPVWLMTHHQGTNHLLQSWVSNCTDTCDDCISLTNSVALLHTPRYSTVLMSCKYSCTSLQITYICTTPCSRKKENNSILYITSTNSNISL